MEEFNTGNPGLQGNDLQENHFKEPQLSPIQNMDNEFGEDFQEEMDIMDNDENDDDALEQQTQRMIDRAQKGQEKQFQQPLEPVKNPVSAYMMFVKNWRKKNLDKKLSFTQMGSLYKKLSQQQMKPYIEEYKAQKAIYDDYRLQQQISNPHKADNQKGSASIFPLHRVKCIMKQDSFYTPKVESVAATAKAVQFFGEYLLEELKKNTEGKNRITSEDLYQCIGTKNRLFGFLQCLIDEKGFQDQPAERKQPHSHNKKTEEPKVQLEIQNQEKYKRGPPKKVINANKNRLPSNQIRLTDMFKSANNGHN